MSRVKILVNNNIKMSPGKLAAQAVHAALNAYGIEHGAVVVLGGSVKKIMELDVQVHDAGRTELEPGTLTAGAVIEDDKD
jgi:PTH2 family peptidyl-tRNA hydrolase